MRFLLLIGFLGFLVASVIFAVHEQMDKANYSLMIAFMDLYFLGTIDD